MVEKANLLYKIRHIIGEEHRDIHDRFLKIQTLSPDFHYEITTRLFVDSKGYLRVCDGSHDSSERKVEEKYPRVTPKLTLKEFEYKIKSLIPGDKRVGVVFDSHRHLLIMTGLVLVTDSGFKVCQASGEGSGHIHEL